MGKVAVVHTASTENVVVQVGERFRVIEEPQDINDMLLLMTIERNGDVGKVVPIDLGESFAVMSIEPDEEGISVSTYFTIEEEN